MKIIDNNLNFMLAKAAGLVAALIGIIVLAGWAFDIALLRSLLNGAVEMKANTAVGLTLTGLALFGLTSPSSSLLHRASVPFALLACALGLITFGEYVFGWNPGIDELLFLDRANAYNTIPGRMSPYSALTFFAIGLALPTLSRPRLHPVGQLLAWSVMVIGVVSIIGYVWNASEIVTDVFAPPIALNTAIAFLLLGAGMLLVLRGKNEVSTLHHISHASIQFKLIGSFICTLVLLIAIGGYLYRSIAEFAEAERWVSHTQEVRADLNDLYSTLSDAETAQRNYLLTGERQYLELLLRYRSAVQSQLVNVSQLVSDNPTQQASLKKLQALISMRLTAMEQLNATFELKGLGAAKTQISSGPTHELRQDIHDLTRQMGNVEMELLIKRQRQVVLGRQNTLVALLLTILAVAGIFLFLFYSVNREKNLREAREEELAQAKTIAENASQAKSAFLSSMSHELRTPLNAILGFSQILASDTLPSTPDQKKQFVSHILKAGRHLLTLINEILDLAKVESGSVVLSLEPVGMNDILQECQSMVEPMGAQRNIRLVFPPTNDLYVMADRTRLKQVMLNLLSNAIKYNRDLGTVIVNCDVIDTERVRIAVQDTGAGLRPAQIDALFQPFNRLGQETGVEEGTGIGLVVTKRLVELMGGVIGVSSTAGIGSVFWIDLPATVPPQSKIENNKQQTTSISNTNRREVNHPTLLYIEDNPANLKLVEELVRFRSDLRLISAPEGHLGIELARTHLPDLILMDINLPGMSGDDARKVLQTSPKTAHIPIIAVTANALPHDIQKGLDAGFYRYITKPINIEEFTEAIDSALKLATSRPRAI